MWATFSRVRVTARVSVSLRQGEFGCVSLGVNVSVSLSVGVSVRV